MHSRIFQIGKEPLTKEEYIVSSSIPEWFTYSVADYIDDDCNRESDIDWLMSAALGGVASVDGDKLVFHDTSRYFEGKYEAFIKAAEQLTKTSFDNFLSCCAVRAVLFNLKEAYNDRYGFYVYNSDDDSLDTLDDFMRSVKDGETYYIGGVIDYHY